MDLTAKYHLRRESFHPDPRRRSALPTFHQHHTKIQQRAWSHFKGLSELFCPPLNFNFLGFFFLSCEMQRTYLFKNVTSKSTEMMSPIKRRRSERTSPGRAVRGKLVNMVLYCTHDICFPFSFLSFFFFPFFGVSNKNWHYMFLHPSQNSQSNLL